MLLLFVAFALLMLPSSASMPHSLTAEIEFETERHSILVDVKTADQSHVHEDGEPFEQSAGHAHGHDPADHSHYEVYVVGENDRAAPRLVAMKFRIAPESSSASRSFGLERPPKHTALA